MPAGAPTKYKPEYCEQATKLCKLGSTDKQLAEFFDVDESTINEWKTVHQEFSLSIKEGKDIADAEIAHSLYHRAKGYSHPEDVIFNDKGEPLIVPTIKHYAPDSTAIIFWLKNRRPDQWRDKSEVDHKNLPTPPSHLTVTIAKD
jgi:hypothetical protein